ncbi:MAG: type II toxin-antitoxin system VapC family toxin [Burkholderiales bacterium]|nr:type II toxin-antitoxin system VapC family toxin [Burkholderiales bacterium]
MNVVVDASVAIKWIVPFKSDEADSGRALQLLSHVRNGEVTLYQPPHWFAEIAGVIVRLSPATIQEDIADLYEIKFQRIEGKALYVQACKLARALDHHLFDTLYHAVALHVPDAVLVTADERYYDKAHSLGQIVRLAEAGDLLGQFERRAQSKRI